ncbi:hypothetical protein [Chryseobacterium sp. NFX27]|uniref:hypothetical protein n=1 Tax=Chryseobacterium sp. NFX27 TaxID=2819618 RepID=UPI003CFAE76C
MKKYILYNIILFPLFFGCQTVQTKPDYNFKYHEFSYDNSKVVWEIMYDSKTGVYEEKVLEKLDDKDFSVDKISVFLKQEDLKKIYDMYLSLQQINPNDCIYSNNGELVFKSTLRFYANKSKSDDLKCNITIENKKYSNLWGEIFQKIKASDSYRNAYPEEFIGR